MNKAEKTIQDAVEVGYQAAENGKNLEEIKQRLKQEAKQ